MDTKKEKTAKQLLRCLLQIENSVIQTRGRELIRLFTKRRRRKDYSALERSRIESCIFTACEAMFEAYDKAIRAVASVNKKRAEEIHDLVEVLLYRAEQYVTDDPDYESKLSEILRAFARVDVSKMLNQGK